MEVTSENNDQILTTSIGKSIRSMLYTVPPLSSDFSIYRVPERLRNVKEESYTPIMVSIGPLHHGREKLESMEYQKRRYLYFLLSRPTGYTLEKYIHMLMTLEREARNCYAEAISFTKEDFVTMLLLDGCFIVELFRQYQYDKLRQEHDQLFKNHWILNAVHRDILLLENQLPFFVLEELFNMINDTSQEDYLRQLGQGGHLKYSFLELTKIFLCQYTIVERSKLQFDDTKGDNMVHLLLNHFTKTVYNNRRGVSVGETDLESGGETDLTFIPSATELKEAGVKFEQKKPRSQLLDVTFDLANGILCMPPLIIDDRTESFFRNLIALEQSHSSSTTINDQESSGGSATKLSDYVTLVDCLINTSADVELLRKSGIINNHLGDNEEVAQLVNKLRNGIITRSNEFYYSGLFEHVNTYYKNKWHAWKATLRRDYFNTPWAYIAFISAIFLLVCTFIQTVCSVLQVEQ